MPAPGGLERPREVIPQRPFASGSKRVRRARRQRARPGGARHRLLTWNRPALRGPVHLRRRPPPPPGPEWGPTEDCRRSSWDPGIRMRA